MVSSQRRKVAADQFAKTGYGRTGHARFHVVWRITSYLGFALIALFLKTPRPGIPLFRLWFRGGCLRRLFHYALEHTAPRRPRLDDNG
jgi:hypothetical protein